MKKTIISLAVVILSGTLVYILFLISQNNKCSSVRSYFCNKQITKYTNTSQSEFINGDSNISHDDEPPSIQIINYKDGDIIDSDSINIQILVNDNISPLDKIKITGSGLHSLQIGINPIFVAAQDESGNIGIDYILVERP
ncbi:MAG: hypothetical protein V3575_04535 [Candidatus Absconditabacteria bacterium]